MNIRMIRSKKTACEHIVALARYLQENRLEVDDTWVDCHNCHEAVELFNAEELLRAKEIWQSEVKSVA